MAATADNNELPEGFTLSLALVDAIPVALFCASAGVFGAQVGSPLFIAGAALAFLGGAGKVSWKLLIALAQRNYPALSKQMRVTMPVGFVLMIVGAALHASEAGAVLVRLASLPSVILVIAWIGCMCAMGYFAGHRNQLDARSNWIEQLTNTTGQLCLLLALLLEK